MFIQYFSASGETIAAELRGSTKRRKYQHEPAHCGMVFVSRRTLPLAPAAAAPGGRVRTRAEPSGRISAVQLTHSFALLSGPSGLPLGLKSDISGSVSG